MAPTTNKPTEEEAYQFPFVIANRGHLLATAGEIASQQIELDSLRTEQANEVAAVQAIFAPRIDELAKSIVAKLDAAFSYCQKNEAELFAQEKTILAPGASLEFKLCPPAVQELPGWNAGKIIAALKKWGNWRTYVRIKFELNKQAILADRDKFQPFVLARRGLAIVQARSLIITSAANTAAQASLKK